MATVAAHLINFTLDLLLFDLISSLSFLEVIGHCLQHIIDIQVTPHMQFLIIMITVHFKNSWNSWELTIIKTYCILTIF